jgi:cysteine-rich repeat protein
MRLAHLLAPLITASVLLAAACATKAESTPARLCTPGAFVYCRCQDRQEGTKLCADDGQSFGKCEPCESDTNPVDPDYPPEPVLDAGSDSPAPTSCGDSVPQDGEECDDGNKVDDDGCDQTCKLAGDNPASSKGCPGMPVHVWSAPVSYTGNTATSSNTSYATLPDAGAGCPPSNTTGAGSPDRRFAVTPHKAGTLTVTTSNTAFDNSLWVMTTCSTSASQSYLACKNDTAGNGGETMTFPVEAGKTYSVVVDGVLVNSGVFKITFSL